MFDVDGDVIREKLGWFAYDPSFRGGVNVAVANVTGTPHADVITGAGPGGGPHVRLFTPTGGDRGGFYAYAPAFGGGVNVAVGDTSDDGRNEIVTAPASGGGPHVRTFDVRGARRAPGILRN